MGDFTDIDNVKAWLNITTTADDDLLARLITGISQAMRTYLSRDILSQGYTEVRNGNNEVRLPFANYPVTAVASLTIDGIAVPLASSPTQAGYLFDSQLIYLMDGMRFTKGWQNVVMTYTAGYAAVPYDIEQVCIEWVSLRYKERLRIGMKQQAQAGATVTYYTDALPDSVKLILQQYKKVIPV